MKVVIGFLFVQPTYMYNRGVPPELKLRWPLQRDILSPVIRTKVQLMFQQTPP